jgi:hypothetical protein
MNQTRLYGVLAEFMAAEPLRDAVSRIRHDGRFPEIECYSPFPVPGLDRALGDGSRDLSRWILLGGVLGGACTLALEYYSAAIDYPINVGGRPTASWIAFLPPALEMCLLSAAVCGVIAMLVANGLPRLHHPLFNIAAFERASADRFFMLVRIEDADQAQRAREFIATLSPVSITEVPQ